MKDGSGNGAVVVAIGLILILLLLIGGVGVYYVVGRQQMGMAIQADRARLAEARARMQAEQVRAAEAVIASRDRFWQRNLNRPRRLDSRRGRVSSARSAGSLESGRRGRVHGALLELRRFDIQLRGQDNPRVDRNLESLPREVSNAGKNGPSAIHESGNHAARRFRSYGAWPMESRSRNRSTFRQFYARRPQVRRPLANCPRSHVSTSGIAQKWTCCKNFLG